MGPLGSFIQLCAGIRWYCGRRGSLASLRQRAAVVGSTFDAKSRLQSRASMAALEVFRKERRENRTKTGLQPSTAMRRLMSYHRTARHSVRYNSLKVSLYKSTVLHQSSRFAFCLLVVLLTTSLAVLGQSPSAGDSAERSALERGQEALKNGDIARARVEFEEAVRLAPTDPQSQSALGWALAQQGELDAAVSHLRVATKEMPEFVDAHLTLASVLAQQGKAVEAEQELRMTVQISPENAEAHRILGRMLSQRGSQEEALSEMRRAGELAPERADLQDDLGSVLAQRNQYAEAQAAFKAAV